MRQSGWLLDPVVDGVRQATFKELESTLLRLLSEYEAAAPGRRMAVRKVVIRAKEHARLAARDAAKRVDKEEMILWMTTWLDNPPLFAEWVKIRRRIQEISASLLRQ